MSLNFTHMKVISITCEKSVATKAIELLQDNGALSIRTSVANVERCESFHSSVDLNESQLKLEVLVPPEALDSLITVLSKKFFKHYEVMFFISDAQVLRPDLFFKSQIP
jgi:hypothetical protein